nr:carboxypeptidase regulatory-like domain-containing protein [Micromonospora sp. DSM 115978]
MRLASPGRAALTGALIGVLLLTGAPPAQAAAAGSITGRLTTSTGAPAANARVTVYEAEWPGPVGSGLTDEDGRYLIDGLASGAYRVAFEPVDGVRQYHDRKPDIWDADVVEVHDGVTTVVDERMLETGAISGQIHNADGTPRPDLMINANNLDTGQGHWASTDQDGHFSMPVLPGPYGISFEPIIGSFQRQYVPQKIDEREATRFEVAVGEEVHVEETLLPSGSLSGRLTSAQGQPVANATVEVSTLSWYAAEYAETDSNGSFALPEVLVGSYKVGFSQGERVQYHRGKLRHEDADVVTISSGTNTHVTESLLLTGSVRVSAVDSLGGAPIANFCVGDGGCSHGTGVATVAGLPQGPHEFYLYSPDRTHFLAETGLVEVKANQTVALTVPMRPGARIVTTVTDRQTGAPVEDVCVHAQPAHGAHLPEGGHCSDPAGRMTIGPLERGAYQLFADPRETGYGAQWVGSTGGTGDQRQAVTVQVGIGSTVAAPSVRLDRSGTIAGRVTDASTGAPLDSVQVDMLTGHPAVGTSNGIVTDSQGRYRFPDLGPYEWPLIFSRPSYAAQWSGGTGDRHAALRIPVTTGGTATHDTALVTGTRVSGAVENQTGTPFESGWVVAHNADTGDIMGGVWIEDGGYTMQLLGGQSVYLTYIASLGDDTYTGTAVPATPPRKPLSREARTMALTMAGVAFGGPQSTGPATAVRRTGSLVLSESPRKPPQRPGVFAVPMAGPLVVNITVPTG